MKQFALAFVVLLMSIMIVSGISLAQDGDGDTPTGTIVDVLQTLSVPQFGAEPNDLYPDIVQSRTADGGFVLGDPDAPLVVVEFADFMCPHCPEYEETMDQFIDEFVRTGQARLEYRFFPIVSQVYSPLTSQVAECAGDEGMFWAARSLLFSLAQQQEVTPEISQLVADRLGLDAESLADCVTRAQQFVTDMQLGDALGVNGTPAIMVRVGESDPQWVSVRGEVFDRGGLPYEMLALIAQSVNEQNSGG